MQPARSPARRRRTPRPRCGRARGALPGILRLGPGPPPGPLGLADRRDRESSGSPCASSPSSPRTAGVSIAGSRHASSPAPESGTPASRSPRAAWRIPLRSSGSSWRVPGSPPARSGPGRSTTPPPPPPPRRTPLGGRRIATGQQHAQLVRLQSLGRPGGVLRPPRKPSLRQTLLAQPEPLTVIDQDLDRLTTAVAEDEHVATERIAVQDDTTQTGQTGDPFADDRRRAG